MRYLCGIILLLFLLATLPVYADTVVYNYPIDDFAISSIENPYTTKTHAYKGQLHCHSTMSDGADTPTSIVTAYHDAGYDFVCLTDHNIITADPGVSGILFVPGVEESIGWGGSGGKHLNVFNAKDVLADTSSVIQDIIDNALMHGSIIQVNHPGAYDLDTLDYWSINSLLTTKFYYAIEEQQTTKWDSVLSTGRRVWNVLTDDCHNSAMPSNFNYQWVVVYADNLTIADLQESLANGNFYSTEGPDLTLSLSNRTISVSTSDSSTISWIKRNSGIAKQTTGTTSSYTFYGNELFIRVKITRDSDSKNAYSNPFFVNTGG